MKSADDPPVGKVEHRYIRSGGDVLFFPVQQKEATGVPDLVREVPPHFALRALEQDILTERRKVEYGESQRIRTVFGNDVQRVRRIAERLRHLPSLHVANDAREIDISERYIFHELQTRHDHSRDPEEDYIRSSHECVCGVEVFQVPGFFRPTENRERPEPRGKPGVEDIFVLAVRRSTAFPAGLHRVRHADFQLVTTIAVPDRNPVPPPELTADAPVTDVFHPVFISFHPPLRVETDPSITHGPQSWFSKRLHLYKPLVREIRLDDGVASVTFADAHLVIVYLFDETESLEILHDLFPGLEPVKPTVLLRGVLIHPAGNIEDNDLLQIMPLSNPEVVRVVRRCDFDGAGAELLVDVLIGDNLHLPSDKRKDQVFSHHVLVAFVIGVDRNRHVTEHRLRPRRRDDYAPASIFKRVSQIVKLSILFLVLDFVIAYRRMIFRTPVDYIFASVDEPFLVQLNKDLAHGMRQTLVHRESFTRPVAGNSEFLQLFDNRPAIFFPPLPDKLDELLASERMPVLSFLRETFLDNVLSCYAGVIRPRYPACLISLHPFPADEDILY